MALCERLSCLSACNPATPSGTLSSLLLRVGHQLTRRSRALPRALRGPPTQLAEVEDGEFREAAGEQRSGEGCDAVVGGLQRDQCGQLRQGFGQIGDFVPTARYGVRNDPRRLGGLSTRT